MLIIVAGRKLPLRKCLSNVVMPCHPFQPFEIDNTLTVVARNKDIKKGIALNKILTETVIQTYTKESVTAGLSELTDENFSL